MKPAVRRFAEKPLPGGFTLAELVVVIAILAVLATIGFLSLSWYREDARDAATKTNVRSVYSAIVAEASSTQESARCFIEHDSEKTLTGGVFVMLDASESIELVGGPCGAPGTNYSAWIPDYSALRLDSNRFKTAFIHAPKPPFSRNLFSFDAAASDSGAPILVWAADVTDSTGTKSRIRTFAQVASILSSDAAYVTGDFPSSDIDNGTVAGLIKDPKYGDSSTGALVDGAFAWAPAPCSAKELSGYSVPPLTSWSSAEVVKDIANGKGETVARCWYGTVRLESEKAACDTDYVPANPLPKCVRDTCGGTVPANAVSNETTPGWTGNWTYGQTAWTCKFKCAEGYSWNGAACKSDCSVTAAGMTSHVGLQYAIASSFSMANGTSASRNGTHTFGNDPANGELSANFSFECDDGSTSVTSTSLTGSCIGANYTWNGNHSAPSCQPNSKTASCQGLPANAAWNSASSITQTWNGTAWAPTSAWSHDTTASTTECRFKCDANHTWNGNSCAADTRSEACGGSVPSYATANTAATYAQTWNGSAWAPTYSWTNGASSCWFACNANYSWNGSACAANTRTQACSGLPANAVWNSASSVTQTWNGTAWTPSETGTQNATASATECRFVCQAWYSWTDCSVIGIAGDDTAWRKWANGTYAATCNEYKNPTAPKTYSGNTGSGTYLIDPDGAGASAPFKAYCDMSTDGGGFTLIMMSRESAGAWGSTSSVSKTSSPNYDSWSYAAKNATIIDPAANASTNVVTSAASTVPFKDFLFKCADTSGGCGGADNYSVYSHTANSLMSAKSGWSFTKKTATGWPFSVWRMYTTSGTNNSAYHVPIDTLTLTAKCAPSTSRPYSACVQMGFVWRDFYDFQNAVGFWLKGYQNYAETHSVNVMFGYIQHRSVWVLKADLYVR